MLTELTSSEIEYVHGGFVEPGELNDQVVRRINDWINNNPPPNGSAYEVAYIYDDNWNITGADVTLVPAPYTA